MTPYALASHVFVCFQDEHVVFLDVRNDRYFALEAAKTRGLERLVDGWPVRRTDDTGEGRSLHDSGVVQILTERGLLTRWARAGKDATPVQCETPVDEIHPDAMTETPSVDGLALLRFIRASLGASLSLKLMSFERVIQDAHRRRRRSQNAHAGPAPFDPQRAQDLTAIFTWLRPYFFSAKDACLFEALALGKFLASYGIHPRWVFGVQARPFSAHCWLQHESIVLNDTVEHVAQYTPIMII
jgi:transglutaminase superfamily protein